MTNEIEKIFKNSSKYQKDIYDAFLNTDKNIIIKATAGSGKTTTICNIAKIINLNKYKNIIYTSFNKDIVNEAQKKLPEFISCKTLHSIGFNILNKINNKTKLDNKNKYLWLYIKNYLPELNDEHYRKHNYKNAAIMWKEAYNAVKIIEYARVYLEFNEKKLYDIMLNEHGLVFLLSQIKNCLNLLINNSKSNNIDFSDMIYLPYTYYKEDIFKYDLILRDEAQDFNILQNEFFKNMIGEKTRVVIVGDEYQSIYKFMGTTSKIFLDWEKYENTITLPLSVSYRCPSKIVEKAKKYSPEILHHREGGEFSILTELPEDLDDNSNTMILCRNNAPLIAIFYKLINSKKNCYFAGKDIFNDIKKIIDKLDFKNEYEFNFIKEDIINKKINQIQKGGYPTNKLRLHPEVVNLEDQFEILSIICKNNNSYNKNHLINKLDELIELSNNNIGIKLSTIHKSKGLEADIIYLITKYKEKDFENINENLAPDDYRQEENILFVAITRSKNKLFYLEL